MAAYERIATLMVNMARGASRLLPARMRKGIEDRLFYAIFQATRVENDAYGWRPDQSQKRPETGS